ncbi:flagellar hook capping FlgD N-terminal domain-containing protein [Paenibacillus silvisoli]|uniref:flagellar hook capping FlgD N-terminal domain-containing protein n=1 Tax=Paenibacillus silvisoli TaxID=3110539 RepID=UPI002B1BD8D0|nr:flagellar hook capping FlgD N-terminal domain-containing protein [Paenibacillus silvisoli]
MSDDRISTRNVWPYYSASNVQAATEKKADTSLGKDDFLRILVTQLQNQDPLQPLQDKDFVAQMAQFSSVEQLVNMSDQLSMLRQNLGMASSMIGKEVQWYEYSDSGDMMMMNGQVESIIIKDKVQYARVGDQDIKLDDIVAIADQGGEAVNG